MTTNSSAFSLMGLCFCLMTRSVFAEIDETPEAFPPLTFDEVTLDEQQPTAMVQLLSAASKLPERPVILMLGSLDPKNPPFWSKGLLEDGYLLAAFHVDHPKDPDPARRPQWLHFDQRFAHSYVQGGARAPHDAGRIMDYLIARGDVHPEKIGWMGSSSTAIPGLAVATREPRLAAFVGFVSTGAYAQWLQTWHTNELWRAESKELWPETVELLKFDPIRHVSTMYPTAVLMVNGGADRVVDPATARSFVEAARPFYEDDPHRLRLVVYEGVGHNLPRDVVQMYTEHWFRLYMHPTNPPPPPAGRPRGLPDSVRRTQINDADHKTVVGGKPDE